MYTFHARHRAHTHAQQNMSMIFYMYNLVAFMKSYHGTVLHRYLLDIDTKLKKTIGSLYEVTRYTCLSLCIIYVYVHTLCDIFITYVGEIHCT